jgi:hypothetical protein
MALRRDLSVRAGGASSYPASPSGTPAAAPRHASGFDPPVSVVVPAAGKNWASSLNSKLNGTAIPQLTAIFGPQCSSNTHAWVLRIGRLRCLRRQRCFR